MRKYHLTKDAVRRMRHVEMNGRSHHIIGARMERRHRQEDALEGRRGGGRGRRGGGGRSGAQTFRRGRAIEFYKSLQSKEVTLIAQLEAKEMQSIHQIIAAELKAVQAIKAEFKTTFGIQDEDLVEENSEQMEENSKE